MSRNKDDFACFFCDYGWIILLVLLMLAFAAVLTRNIWGPYVFSSTPTSLPTQIPSRTLPPPTRTPVPTNPPVLTITPTLEPVLGSGDVQITLRWQGRNDLDLHIIDPVGEEIYYEHRSSGSGGILDVDSNANCLDNVTDRSVENIFWPTGDAPIGTYQIYVVYFKNCVEPSITNFTVRVLIDGQVEDFSGQVDAQDDKKLIYKFTR